jgi:hypothetical protein
MVGAVVDTIQMAAFLRNIPSQPPTGCSPIWS